jgi:MFS family permease
MRAVDQQWVITAYLVALAGLMPVAGRLADHLGRRPLYLGGLALFGVGTVICALAPTPGILIGARFVQGAGGAFVQPTALAATTSAVADDDRGWAIGLLSTGGTSFLALGPIIAGALLRIADWRILFAVPLPVVIYAFVEGWRWLPDQREPNPRPFSVATVALLLSGLLLTVLGISQPPLGVDGGRSAGRRSRDARRLHVARPAHRPPDAATAPPR